MGPTSKGRAGGRGGGEEGGDGKGRRGRRERRRGEEREWDGPGPQIFCHRLATCSNPHRLSILLLDCKA